MPTKAVLDANAFINLEGGDAPQRPLAILSQKAHEAHICLYVTPELNGELSRDHDEDRRERQKAHAEKFPLVPVPFSQQAEATATDLRGILFPNATSQRQEPNRVSDCRQLAYAVEFGADYFITEDDAILRRSDIIKRRYLVTAVTPSDMLATLQTQSQPASKDITLVAPKLLIRKATKSDFPAAKAMLSELEADYPNFLERWLPKQFEMDSSAIKKVADVGGEVAGISISKEKSDGIIKLCTFFVHPEYRRLGLGQHLLQHEIVCWATDSIRRAMVTVPIHKRDMIRFFSDRGFRVEGVCPLRYEGRAEVVMGRHLLNRLVTENDWAAFQEEFLEQLLICERVDGIDGNDLWVPALQVEDWAVPFQHTPLRAEGHLGPDDAQIALAHADTGEVVNSWDAYRLETDLFPLVLSWPERTATVIPIKKHYAEMLFEFRQPQTRLWESTERVRLRADNVYYRAGNDHGGIRRGTHIVFYVTDPVKQVVAAARVSDMEIGPADALADKFGPLGVLDKPAVLEAASGSSGRAQAICFDYLEAMEQPVSLRDLNKICPSINLVTASKIGFKQYLELRRLGGLLYG